MSDDRFTREPGDDEDEVELGPAGKPVADRTHIDPKPRSWDGPAPVKQPPFVLAEEVDAFLKKEYGAGLPKPKAKP